MRATYMVSNFTSGELSPQLDGRVDIARYYNGAKTLENLVTLPYGGLIRRPGSVYVASTKDSTKKAILVPFQFSTTQAYQIEFGDRYCRFYANNGQILSSGSALEISTPYLESDLATLQFAQDADTMWITHPSYKTRKLTRGTPSWDSFTKLMLHCDGVDGSATFTDEIGKTVTRSGTAQIDTSQYKFNGASGLFDGNSDYLTVNYSSDFDFGTGDFTIDFWVRFDSVAGTQNFFDWGNGQTWAGVAIKFRLSTSTIQVIIDDTLKVGVGWTPSVNTQHHLEISRSGTNLRVFIDGIQRGTTVTDSSDIDLAGEDVIIGVGTTLTNFLDGRIDEFRASKGIARHTANFTPETSPYFAAVITFSINNYAPELLTLDVAAGTAWEVGDTITGNTSGATCVIVSITDTTHFRVKNRDGDYTLGEVLTNGTYTADQGAAHPTATGDPFGADGSDDCPSCVSIHEQRLFLANTNNNPQKVWGSVSGDYEDMTTGADSDDALVYVIGSEQVNAIRWLSSGEVLSLGTLGGVFGMSSGSEGLPLTPTNVVVKRETT